MAYETGSKIFVSDTNAFIDTVSKIYGNGIGDYGYGASVSFSQVAVFGAIRASMWNALRDTVAACAAHQGTNASLLPPAGSFVTGNIIGAFENTSPTSNPYDLNSVIAAIDTNRLNISVGNSVLVSNINNITAAAAWSTTINCTMDINFGNENNARYFFNSGGKIRISFQHPNGASAQDNDWRNTFGNRVGVISFAAHTTSSTGTSAIGSSVGYYEIIDTDTLIFNGTSIGTGLYSANDVLIYARYMSYSGTNGGNGATVRITVSLQDDHTNVFSDTVAAGTRMIIDVIKAGDLPIATPTTSIIDGF